MSRSARLLSLLQILRRHRKPVSGQTLAGELGISLRTLYRDIATLQSQGAEIEGEAGVGYVLKPSYMLPPLMFTRDEIEVLMLGFRFVIQRADTAVTQQARNVMAKIEAVLPDDLRRDMLASSLLAGPGVELPEQTVSMDLLRNAVRTERPVAIAYRDLSGKVSQRTIWPFALSYFDGTRLLVAWCTLRGEFRHFRTDRIESATMQEGRYPKRRVSLLRDWRRNQSIPEHVIE